MGLWQIIICDFVCFLLGKLADLYYDAIAIKSKVAPGTVKNRLKFIFSVLEVGDKHGFLNEYSTFEICYGEYTSEKIKSMKITETNLIN